MAFILRCILGLVLVMPSYADTASSIEPRSILTLLNITPSAQSRDYVNNKQQFQLHHLLTEQRHPKTLELGYVSVNNPAKALQTLFAVDQDITVKLRDIANSKSQLQVLQHASNAMAQALLNNRKIYVYGCGATGRLAIQLESMLWRPFWQKIQSNELWPDKLSKHLPATIADSLIGEITGADRALISSLEGFEDLPLIGRLQLKDHGIQQGDVVFAITEGGETSSVIGTILGAANAYQNKLQAHKNLYFVYNNPDKLLLPFKRSQAVIQNPAVTKINLSTGPQALAGSTRMQATTIELYVMGVLLEDAIYQVLDKYLTKAEIKHLGFPAAMNLRQRLLYFQTIQQRVAEQAQDLSRLTELEADTYAKHRFTFYLAKKGVLTVFTDSTERAPTFRLYPIDSSATEQRRSWLQVWTPAVSQQAAWLSLLHRPFRGLDASKYQPIFAEQISDPYLRATALKSLAHAGAEQQQYYNFAYMPGKTTRYMPGPGDLGIAILLSGESVADFYLADWIKLMNEAKAEAVVIRVAQGSDPAVQRLGKNAKFMLTLPIASAADPLRLNAQVGLKMLLNAHSTAVMAKLGRVVGNTMTNVSPSNLKLIGRATFLIQTHVNDIIQRPSWQKDYGKQPPISYAQANAVLYAAIDYLQQAGRAGQESEVALAIVRCIASLERHKSMSWQQVEEILTKQSLANYLTAQK